MRQKQVDNNQDDISQAQMIIKDLKLLEPPIVGRIFTSTNGQSDPI